MTPWLVAGFFCLLWLCERRGRLELREFTRSMLWGAPGAKATTRRVTFSFPDPRCADCGAGLSLFAINAQPLPWYCKPCGDRHAAQAEHRQPA